jgi:hypothetical protein
LKSRRAPTIAAPLCSPTPICSRIAASSVQGTGDQNFARKTPPGRRHLVDNCVRAALTQALTSLRACQAHWRGPMPLLHLNHRLVGECRGRYFFNPAPPQCVKTPAYLAQIKVASSRVSQRQPRPIPSAREHDECAQAAASPDQSSLNPSSLFFPNTMMPQGSSSLRVSATGRAVPSRTMFK